MHVCQQSTSTSIVVPKKTSMCISTIYCHSCIDTWWACQGERLFPHPSYCLDQYHPRAHWYFVHPFLGMKVLAWYREQIHLQIPNSLLCSINPSSYVVECGIYVYIYISIPIQHCSTCSFKLTCKWCSNLVLEMVEGSDVMLFMSITMFYGTDNIQ